MALTSSVAFHKSAPIDAELPASTPWIVTRKRGKNGELRICYRRDDGRLRQYAALHDHSGYFRLAPDTAWGTSIVLPPTLWSRGRLRQGAALQMTWRMEKTALALSGHGVIGGLQFRLKVLLSPPQLHCIEARVQVETSGAVALDHRCGEAFKPVMLSSMRVSRARWDAAHILLDGQTHDFDETSPSPRKAPRGWIVAPDALISTRKFGFAGGNSDWKRDAPTVEVRFAQPMPIAGWRSANRNPNGDNLALWAACDEVLPAWNYTIIASHAEIKR